MRAGIALVAAMALVPAMVGPSRAAEGATLVLALCNGGAVSVPVGGDGPQDGPQGPPVGPCCAKACHSGDRRKALDKEQ